MNQEPGNINEGDSSTGKPSFGDPSAEFYFVRGGDLASMTDEERIAFFTALFESMVGDQDQSGRHSP